MLHNISLGTFYPGSSILHRLQARTKFLIIIWLLIVLIIANRREWHFAPYIGALLIIACGMFLSRVGLREIWKRSWFLVVISFVSALFSVFATTENSHVLLKIGPLYIMYGVLLSSALLIGGISFLLVLSSYIPVVRPYWRSRPLRVVRVLLFVIVLAVLIFCWLTLGASVNKPLVIGPLLITQLSVWILMTTFVVFAVLYFASLLLTLTTMPVALIEGLSLLLSPLRRLRFPIDDFALMALLALRFIPTLLNEAEELMKAQTARGADVTHGTLKERLQSMIMFFHPLLQGSFRRASELATALEARGYRSTGTRTFLHETKLHLIDYLALLSIVVITGGTLLL